MDDIYIFSLSLSFIFLLVVYFGASQTLCDARNPSTGNAKVFALIVLWLRLLIVNTLTLFFNYLQIPGRICVPVSWSP